MRLNTLRRGLRYLGLAPDHDGEGRTDIYMRLRNEAHETEIGGDGYTGTTVVPYDPYIPPTVTLELPRKMYHLRTILAAAFSAVVAVMLWEPGFGETISQAPTWGQVGMIVMAAVILVLVERLAYLIEATVDMVLTMREVRQEMRTLREMDG